MLGSLDGSKQTYTDAKALLEQAFGDKEIQKYNLLTKLTSLHLKHTEPFELYSEFNNLTSSLENLIVTVKDVYKFALWKALPHDYQTQYLAYSKDSVPTLDVLRKYYFDVCRRVQNSSNPNTVKEKNPSFKQRAHNSPTALTLAMGIERPIKSYNNSQGPKGQPHKPHCSLCYRTGQPYSHKLGCCKTYPTAHDKVNKLKELGGCTKCTSLKHSTVNCNYQGEKCRTCQGMHHNILCISNKTSGVTHTNSQVENKVKK